MQGENDRIKEKSALEKCLRQFGVAYEGISCICGPTYNLYKLTPRPGDRISRITALQSDISLAFGLMLRIVTMEECIGIEIPHKMEDRVPVDYASLDSTYSGRGELPVMIGRDIDGKVMFEDLTAMPHLLIAGASRQETTNAVRVFVASLIQNLDPGKLRFALFDPGNDLMVCRQLFSQGYLVVDGKYTSVDDGLEHCMARTREESLDLLSSLEKEMEERYEALSRCSISTIRQYHQRHEAGNLPDGEKSSFPYIVTIIDEFADLMVQGETLRKIVRLAQKGRAVGIHLIISTQSPGADVITGIIKATFPTRLAFETATCTESRRILDYPGAELLRGNGDALFSKDSDLERIQIPNLSEDDLSHVIGSYDTKHSGRPYYLPCVDDNDMSHDRNMAASERHDKLFRTAAIVVVAMQKASVALLQRKLCIGFSRAGRIIDQLEHAGIVGEMKEPFQRKVLVDSISELDEMLGGSQ